MSENSWNPWKMTAIGMALVMVTALITGLVVANWSGSSDSEKTAKLGPQTTTTAKPAVKPAPSAPRTVAAAPPVVATQPAAVPQPPAVPTQAAVDACNQQVAQAPTTQDKTLEVVKDAAIGAVVGAAVGAAGGAIADGGRGAGKGAAIGGVLGAGGGMLYGLNQNKQHD